MSNILGLSEILPLPLCMLLKTCNGTTSTGLMESLSDNRNNRSTWLKLYFDFLPLTSELTATTVSRSVNSERKKPSTIVLSFNISFTLTGVFLANDAEHTINRAMISRKVFFILFYSYFIIQRYTNYLIR